MPVLRIYQLPRRGHNSHHTVYHVISYHIIALFRSYRYVSMYISMLQLNRLLLLIKIANCKSYLDGFLVAIAFVGQLHFSVITWNYFERCLCVCQRQRQWQRHRERSRIFSSTKNVINWRHVFSIIALFLSLCCLFRNLPNKRLLCVCVWLILWTVCVQINI